MRQLPEFITFTGVDDDTPIGDMVELARLYPIEWGVLLSPLRQGKEARYPSWRRVQELAACHGELTLSAHLCGGHSREIMDRGQVSGVDAMLGRWFRRAQVNHTEPDHRAVSAWARRVGVDPIVQHRYRDGFTRSIEDVALLYDVSGGRGVQPDGWPASGDVTVLYGYAGGLGPDNVAEAVDYIGRRAARYWIDMESRVRDSNDRFSLEACRAVCEAVYGRSLFEGA